MDVMGLLLAVSGILSALVGAGFLVLAWAVQHKKPYYLHLGDLYEEAVAAWDGIDACKVRGWWYASLGLIWSLLSFFTFVS